MWSRRALLRAGGVAAVGALAGMGPSRFLGRAEAAPLAKVKDLGVLRVAVYRDNRPWSWTDGGQTVGIDADVARAIAERLGVRADIAEFIADESADDDLRNAVWKGGRLGFQPCDLMMHVPFDRAFANRNDQVAIVAPYYRERFAFTCDSDIACEEPPVQWSGKRLAVELDSIPDFYLIGSFGGVLAKDVTHYMSGVEAVRAVETGKADGALATRAQIEHVAGAPGGATLHTRKSPLPAFMSPGWDIGMAVRENSRTLGDAVEEIVTGLAQSGAMASIFGKYGVRYVPALVVSQES